MENYIFLVIATITIIILISLFQANKEVDAKRIKEVKDEEEQTQSSKTELTQILELVKKIDRDVSILKDVR